MQEAFAEVEGEVLAVVASHTYLTLYLLLGSFELRIAQWLLHELIQFLANQAEAAFHVVLIAAEIDAPGARVAIGNHRAFYGVNQAVVLSQGEVQLGVHTRSAQHIIKQIERHSAVVVHIVSAGSNHHMSLMGILLHHNRLPGRRTHRIHRPHRIYRSLRIHRSPRNLRHLRSLRHLRNLRIPCPRESRVSRFSREICVICEICVTTLLSKLARTIICERPPDKLHQFLEINIPISEEYRIIRPVKLLREPQRILRLESPNLLGCAQDIMPQRRTLEEDILKLIIYQFGRRIVIALYLIADYLHLLIYLRLRINRVEDDVGKQVHGPCDVLLQDGGVIHRSLLVGVGIQVAAHTLQTVEYVPGFSAFGALESDVLAEMRQALLARLLVAGAGVYLVAAIHHLAIRWQVDDAESVV